MSIGKIVVGVAVGGVVYVGAKNKRIREAAMDFYDVVREEVEDKIDDLKDAKADFDDYRKTKDININI